MRRSSKKVLKQQIISIDVVLANRKHDKEIIIESFETLEQKYNVNFYYNKYTNLYYLNDHFYYFIVKTDKQDLKTVKLLGGPEHSGVIPKDVYMFKPII